MKTIYVDVLIILNIYVNFFLLRATAGLTHTPLKTARCVASAIIGSVFSLTILLPEMNFLAASSLKLAAAVIITASAFGIKDKIRTLKLVFYFYLVNFIFGGIIMLFYITFRPRHMAIGNTYFYIDFSLISLLIFTAAAYAAVTVLRRFLDKSGSGGKYRLTVRRGDLSISVEAFADTGNTLVDIFSGKPVIICRQKDISGIAGLNSEPVPENAETLYRENSIRFIPYSTIGNTGMIPIFKPDSAAILDCETGKEKRVDVMIGINTKDVPAIFNPRLLC